MPISKPAQISSTVDIFPDPYTIAFGGVEIGRHIAAEDASAIGTASRDSPPVCWNTAMVMGSSRLAVAVLLIRFDMTIAT